MAAKRVDKMVEDASSEGTTESVVLLATLVSRYRRALAHRKAGWWIKVRPKPTLTGPPAEPHHELDAGVRLEIEQIGGQCPVQAEGKLDGNEFYFRARGERWTLSVGGADVVASPDWHYEESYGESRFDAGWMSKEEALNFLRKAANLYHRGKQA
jgi:hypothetical protein